MRVAHVAPVAVVIGLFMPAAVDAVEISPNESNDGVILRDREVKDGRSGRRPFDSNPQALEDLRHPCTYNGLLLTCDIPDPGTPLGTVFTPGLARQAVTNIPLPGLALNVQPDGETLVNVPTIFWVDPQPFETSIELLGREIEVEATPAAYTWVHGDGTAQTTDHPGQPYPREDITHRYWQPAELEARVDTTYTVRFSIDGDGWTDLGEPLVASGPPTIIDVHEAAPVLVR